MVTSLPSLFRKFKMTKEILDQMRSELFDTHWCKQDFEKYDIKELEDSWEPFFWCVREGGTSLVHIGPTRMGEYMANQTCRFAWFREENAPLMSIIYWKDPSYKFFYWDGFVLKQVHREDIEDIFMNIWRSEYERLMEKYSDEFDLRREPLQIRMTDEIKKRYDATVGLGIELNDHSLEDCIERLSHYTRCAIDHYVEIYGDFAKNSFGFCEWVNGQQRLVGGIIYSDYVNENRWSIHT